MPDAPVAPLGRASAADSVPPIPSKAMKRDALAGEIDSGARQDTPNPADTLSNMAATAPRSAPALGLALGCFHLPSRACGSPSTVGLQRRFSVHWSSQPNGHMLATVHSNLSMPGTCPFLPEQSPTCQHPGERLSGMSAVCRLRFLVRRVDLDHAAVLGVGYRSIELRHPVTVNANGSSFWLPAANRVPAQRMQCTPKAPVDRRICGPPGPSAPS